MVIHKAMANALTDVTSLEQSVDKIPVLRDTQGVIETADVE
ncbi:hypothetical protein [Abyssibacter profundi]|nr:hypothetical protein [Abyssibacter profundi]